MNLFTSLLISLNLDFYGSYFYPILPPCPSTDCFKTSQAFLAHVAFRSSAMLPETVIALPDQFSWKDFQTVI